jgi:hypothetical protein
MLIDQYRMPNSNVYVLKTLMMKFTKLPHKSQALQISYKNQENPTSDPSPSSIFELVNLSCLLPFSPEKDSIL